MCKDLVGVVPTHRIEHLESLLGVDRSVTESEVMVARRLDQPPRGFRSRKPGLQRTRQQRIGGIRLLGLHEPAELDEGGIEVGVAGNGFGQDD